MRKSQGRLTKSELQDDLISARHKELIKKNEMKYATVPEQVFSHVYENFKAGLLYDFFTQFEDEEQDKMKKSLYDVMSMYVQVYNNLSIRVLDMIR